MAREVISHLDILKRQGQGSNNLKKEKPTGITAYSMWQARIAAAIRWRQSHWNGDGNWKRAYKLYGGKHWKYQDEQDPAADTARDLITVNVTMSTVNNMVPFLINSNPLFILKPRKPSDAVSAQLQQEILNYQFKLQHMIDQIKECVLDAAIIGHGIAKTGFTYELDEAVSKQTGSIVYDDFIKKETPFLGRVNPFCFIYDPTASDYTLRTARWCGEILYKHYDDVVENAAYSSTVRNGIKNGKYNPKVINVDTEYGAAFSNEEYSIFEDVSEYQPQILKLFEIWDKKHKKRLLFLDGVDEPLQETNWPYDYLVGFPYKKLDFIKVPNEHYGVGIPYCIEDQQIELDRSRTYQFQHRRRFNRKYRVSETMDEPEKTKLQDGEDGTVISVPDNIRIEPIEDAPMPTDMWQVEGVIKQDIMELSGMDSLIRGGPLPSRTTGVEVSTRTQVFRMKIDDLVDRTDKFVLALGTDVNAHLKANLIKERVVKIVGLQGEFWYNVGSDDIQAEVDVSMESVAAPRTNPDTDKQQAMFLLQTAERLQPLMQQSGVQLNFAELFAWVLEKFGYKDVGRFFERALIPNVPLEEKPPGEASAPNVNGATPMQPMSPADIQNQFGMAAMQNNGMQMNGAGV